MAAITIKFGEEEEVTELDSLVGSLSPAEAVVGEEAARTGLAGTAAVNEAVDYLAEVTATAINVSHAGLETMAWLRRVVSELLVGRTLQPVQDGRKVWLVVDPPIAVDETPPWHPTSKPLARARLLSWTGLGAAHRVPAGRP